jgi:hypothetical protein
MLLHLFCKISFDNNPYLCSKLLLMKNFFIVSLFALIFSYSYAQLPVFSFSRNQNIVVKDSTLNTLANPWGGGINACQFSQIDLNFDGIKDIFIFDRSAMKILPFINNGAPNTFSYTFAPEYSEKFPKLHDWVILTDYNQDGKEDIFTYGAGGITVYKNTSTVSGGLSFVLVTNMINSLQGPNYTNLLVTQVDYPAISDVDNDGDLDIITFFGLGAYVEYHRNLSQETYGNSDSLKYELQEYCWGNFAENTNNNSIQLNITCPWSTKTAILENEKSGAKHTGSTLLAEDLDGDLDKELIVGDVDYPNLILLTNGGSPSNADMTAKDSTFPSNSLPVNLFSFPVPALLDINNDGKKDLLVSPFEANINVSENYQSCWYYENTGTSSHPVFEFQKNNIFQSDMIETGAGAYPVFADYNADGLQDMFIGNFGRYDSSYYSLGYLYSVFNSSIALYKNIGTQSAPVFQFVTNDFAGTSSQKINGIVPTFGDLDGDGDEDMLIGDTKGNIYYYQNTAGVGNQMNMVLFDTIPIDVGDFSTPQLVDLDEDSLLDLVIGEKKGNLNYYKNTGSNTNPVFTLETDSLGHIEIIDHSWSNYGYSVPCFFKDSANHWQLFVGSESGYIFHYKDIESNLSGNFTLESPTLGHIYNGLKSAPAVAFLNSDKYPELITGNISGGVSYYNGTTPQPESVNEIQVEPFSILISPNPASSMVQIDIDSKSFEKEFIVEIYSPVGKMLIRKSFYFQCSVKLSTENLVSGIYLCRVLSDKGKFVCKKLIITR